MPSQPKIDQVKVSGPRSLAGLMIHSQFWLVRFTMLLWACRSWSQSGLACPACLILMFAPASYHTILILKIAKYFLGELEVTGFMPANKCRSYKNYVCYNICHGSTDKTADRNSWTYLQSTTNWKHYLRQREYFTCIQRSFNPIFIPNR